MARQVLDIAHILCITDNIWESSLNEGGDRFWIHRFSQLWRPGDLDHELGWPWILYRLICLIDFYPFQYWACGSVEFYCERMDGQMDVRTDGHLNWFLGHLNKRWPENTSILVVLFTGCFCVAIGFHNLPLLDLSTSLYVRLRQLLQRYSFTTFQQSCFRYPSYSRSFTTTIIIVHKTGGDILVFQAVLLVWRQRHRYLRLSSALFQATTSLKRTHYVPGCVYCLEAYALCYWMRVLHWSVRVYFLVACTALRRMQCVPGCVYCPKAFALCSWLRVLPESVRTTFLAACRSLKRTHYVLHCVYCFEAYALFSWLHVVP